MRSRLSLAIGIATVLSMSESALAQETARPFATWTDTLPYRRGLVIWVRNTTQDTLTSIRLTVDRCLNIGPGCGRHATQRVAPGDSVSITTIRPRLWDDRYVYALHWDWAFISSGTEEAPR